MDNGQDPADAKASRVPRIKSAKGSDLPEGERSDSPVWVSKGGSAGLDHKWPVLVVELVHLLGLFLSHSRYSKSALATDALFNQLLRHVDLLSEAVEDDKSLNIRQIAAGDNRRIPQFQVQCGPVVIHGDHGWHGLAAPSSLMMRALAQAFGCLAEQGIRTLKLYFGDRSKEQNEKLRLALNIVARFFQAVGSNASITFRYYGRALTIPLIRDKKGQPDPNLTVMAGLNGLSAANTRELIKQAESFYALKSGRPHADPPLSCYDRIFGLRSLRAQLIRSPVEINLAPLLETLPEPAGENTHGAGERFEAIDADSAKQHHHGSKNSLLTEVIETGYSLKSLSSCMQAHDIVGQQQLSKVFSADVTQTTPQSLAVVLHDISSLLHHIERQQQSTASGHVLLKFLTERVERIPDAIIEKMTIHRQSISLSSGGQSIVIGMMHPRLLDLVTLSKERVLTRRKFVAMQTLGFDFDNNDIATLAEKFEINRAEVEHAITTLKSCFADGRHFRLKNLKKQFPVVVQQADTLFEMLWCYLKQTELGPERLDLLTAIGICGQHLKDVKHTFRFLLSDIYHDPFDLDFSDRNAFLLVNALLARDRHRLITLMDRTPENLLQNMNETNKENQIYAAWRLDTDQVRVLTKQRTLNDSLMTSLLEQPPRKEEPLKSSFILSLEREALLFLAVSGGQTARIILRDVIIKYGNPARDFYRSEPSLGEIRRVMDNLQIAIRGIGRVGEQKDLNLLKELERIAYKFKTIYADFELARQVNEMVSRISMAIKAIQTRL